MRHRAGSAAIAVTLACFAPGLAAAQPKSINDVLESAGPAHPPGGMTPGTIIQPVKPGPPVVAAKTLFGAAKSAAPLEARAIGSYAKGCLAGARQLAVDGPAWQSMRLSRNRQWGHPDLIRLVERFSEEARADGWPGLLVGDISQPRGGPMLTGHNSHQIGLDADIWFTPMPARRLSALEREELPATSMLAAGDLSVNLQVWTDSHVRLLKRAASYTEVERVLVHPAIKRAVCEATAQAPPAERAWLAKVRPIWGHFYHFHVRIGCPRGLAGCVAQPPPPGDDGCGKELADWYKLLTAPPKPPGPPGPPVPPKPPMTLDQLPAECRVVLEAGRGSTPARQVNR
jgi:penicillin-insensitive murein endopeptidase